MSNNFRFNRYLNIHRECLKYIKEYNFYIKMIPELSGVKLHWLAC